MKNLLSVLSLMLLGSCSAFDKPEDIPAYLFINDLNLIVNEENEGTASHKITDVWVTAGNTFIGTFPLGTTFPVLSTGPNRIAVNAGIKENGISATRLPYPFYEPFVTTIHLSEGSVDTIVPTFRYKSNAIFAWMEDFEGTMGLKSTAQGRVAFNHTNDIAKVFEGEKSAVAFLDSTQSFLEVESIETFSLPRGKPVWVEINYKSDVPVLIGIISISQTDVFKRPYAGFNASEEWNKIYINLTNIISEEPAFRSIKIMLSAGLPTSQPTGTVYIDNIKLLYLD
ncbi:MAG: hypothetical protein M3Q97_09695 [Bacteroidota bacterium]|nr:hypothetical protein [Bacteroidota bacterium]